MSVTSGISSMLNTRLRFSGMASGLDTESMIQQLMRVERMRVDKVKQDRQRLEWKQNDYRDITNLLRSFKDDFFDVLKPTSNMRSASTYKKYTPEYGTEGVVTAVGGAGVSSLTHEIAVTTLAKAATGISTAEVIAGTDTLSISNTMDELKAKGVITNSNFTLTINGKNISMSGSETLGNLINKVNSSDAGVTLSYSSFLDKFTLTSKQTGAGTITLSDTAGFFTGVKLTSITAGNDAKFTLDGKASTNVNNTFNLDGVTYSLLKEGASTSVTLKQDTEAIYKNITDFVGRYNAVIEKINTELGEKAYRNYAPLTDEQKESMSESDIKLWEEKSKSGSLKGDGLLSSIVSKMRNAVANAVEGISGTLASIGISTGDYRDKGKLIIDETKLKTALSNNPDKVINLLTQESAIAYSPDMTAADRQIRDSQNGIANRLYDILLDNIRTKRDDNGKKGLLLEKAGIIGDLTEFKNSVTEQLDDKDKQINKLLDMLANKEDHYYKKFSAMEEALSRMNSQSSWISQQFSNGQ